MATINDIIAAQVAKAREAMRRDATAESGERESDLDAELVYMQWQELPHLQRTVTAWFAKLATVRPHMPLAPMERSATGQAAHVVCLGWNNPKAVNQYVREVNIFWLNYGRHLESQSEAAEVSPEAWATLPTNATNTQGE